MNLRDKYVLFPIKNEPMWKMYKQAVASFWTPEEIDLSTDVLDWEHKLTEDERTLLENILAFFAASDGIVNENLAENLLRKTIINEAKCFYGFQIAMENIHSETYSMLIDTLIKSNEKKEELFSAIETSNALKKKSNWCISKIEKEKKLPNILLAFAIVEGIFFSSSFCAIFHFKKRGLLPGLCFSNELISRDEGLHRDFAVEYIKQLVPEPNRAWKKYVKDTIYEAVELETIFVKDSFEKPILGMNCGMMVNYVEYVADHLLDALGLEKMYNVQNPFPFMESISLQGKTNFFEKRVSEYSKAGVGSEYGSKKFTLTEDF